MPTSPHARKPRSYYAYLVVAAGLFGLIQAYALLSPILLSLLLILLISLAVNPIISWIRTFTGGRKVATALVVAALAVLIVFTGWAFFSPMKSSVLALSRQFPAYWERLQKPLIKLEKQAVISEEKIQAEVAKEVAQETGAPVPSVTASKNLPASAPKPPEAGPIRSQLNPVLQGAVTRFAAVAFNLTSILVVLVTVFFGVMFTLMNPRPIFGAIFSVIPERHHAQTLTIVQRIGKFIPGWAASTLLGMATIGLLVFLLMWPIFGFMDALVLGLIAGLLEAVPYIGPMLSAVPALLFALAKGGMTPLWVVVIYLAIQALENNVILPFIMARGMKLHPLAVIFSMLLCVAAFGVLGVLVAAPLVGIVDILHDEIYRKRFLPSVSDADLDRLARKSLHEKMSENDSPRSPST
jgi:predicted PurR-regulated permease PerM